MTSGLKDALERQQPDEASHAELATGLSVVLRIADRWTLSDVEVGVLLGGVSRTTVSRWRRRDRHVRFRQYPELGD